MTDLLERAVAIARELEPSQQDRLARLMIAATEDEPVELTADEEAQLAEGIAQADRGEFASDEQVRATFARYGVDYVPS